MKLQKGSQAFREALEANGIESGFHLNLPCVKDRDMDMCLFMSDSFPLRREIRGGVMEGLDRHLFEEIA